MRDNGVGISLILYKHLIGYASRLLIIWIASALVAPHFIGDLFPFSSPYRLWTRHPIFPSPDPGIMYTRRFSLFSLLAILRVSNLTIALTAWESIHQTIHTYPLAIDPKDFALLSQVLTLQSIAYSAYD